MTVTNQGSVFFLRNTVKPVAALFNELYGLLVLSLQSRAVAVSQAIESAVLGAE